MHLTQIIPTPEQLAQLMATPKDTPITIVNIINFKEKVASTNKKGSEAHARYFKNAQPFVTKANTKLIWRGNVATTLVGVSENQPDLIFLVEYPSVAHFLQIIPNPAYQKIANDRTMALQYGRLIACNTQN